MLHRQPLGAVALLFALLFAVGAQAQVGETCDPGAASGPVSLIILQSGERVHTYAKSVGGKVAAYDAQTVVFRDGRVVTADVEAAGEHLNALGWGSRPLNIVASLPRAAARPRLSGG
jgi:hypothetical protein